MAGDLLFFAIYVLQQLGVMLGVGAQTLLLCTHLVALHHHEPEHPSGSFSRAALWALGASLVLIIASGVGAVGFHLFTGSYEPLLEPAFLFKWALIAAVGAAYLLQKRVSNWSDTLAWFAGGSWLALFLVHSVAPVTTWLSLGVLYVGWMIFFAAIWAGFVLVMRGAKAAPAPAVVVPALKAVSAPVQPRKVVAPPPPAPTPTPVVKVAPPPPPPPPPPKPMPPPAPVAPPPPPAPVVPKVAPPPANLPVAPVQVVVQAPSSLIAHTPWWQRLMHWLYKPKPAPQQVVVSAPTAPPPPPPAPAAPPPPPPKPQPLPPPVVPPPLTELEIAAPKLRVGLPPAPPPPQPAAPMPKPAAAPLQTKPPAPKPPAPAALPQEPSDLPALRVMPQKEEDLSKYVRPAVVQSEAAK